MKHVQISGYIDLAGWLVDSAWKVLISCLEWWY